MNTTQLVIARDRLSENSPLQLLTPRGRHHHLTSPAEGEGLFLFFLDNLEMAILYPDPVISRAKLEASDTPIPSLRRRSLKQSVNEYRTTPLHYQ